MASFAEFEQAGWRAKAAGYHHLYADLSRHAAAVLLDEAGVDSNSRLLDAGAGPGYIAGAAASRGAEVVAYDFSGPMVRLARSLLPGIRLVQADSLSLPFRTGSFTAMTGGVWLQHMPDRDRAVAEAARVLEPGGTIAMSVWTHSATNRFLGVFQEAIAAAGAPAPAALPPGPPLYAAPDEYRQLLERNGFEDVRCRVEAWPYDFGDPDRLWSGLLGGSLRVAAIIEMQEPAVQARVRAEFERLVAREAKPPGLTLTVGLDIIGGRRARAR